MDLSRVASVDRSGSPSELPAAAAPDADPREDGFLLAWSDAVRFTSDPEAILSETVRRLGRRLGATRVNYAEADAAGAALRVESDWTDGVASVAGGVFPVEALGEAVIRAHLGGEPFQSEDMQADPRVGPEARALYASVQVRGALTAPLVKEGRLLAVLSVQQSAPRAWSAAEVRLVREVAERTWAVLERARAEAELARSRELLHQSEKLAALGAMLGGVGHELNNPLSIIAAQAALLQRTPEGAEVGRRAQVIAEAADRCARIVRTFVAIARQTGVRPARTDLNAVVRAALDLAGADLRAAGVGVERAFDPALPALWADGDQLRQVVLNLVRNACEAMASTPGPRRLEVRTAREGEGALRLEVADTGPGVAAEHRGRIFDPFFTTRPQGAGVGLGLSSSRGVVEAHGGALTLVDSPAGATFHLILPVGSDPAGAPES